MNNQKSVELKSIEIYQQELDAIEKKYSNKTKSIDMLKEKYIEKLQLHKQWSSDVYEAHVEINDRLGEMKKMIEETKKNMVTFRKDWDQLRIELADMEDQYDNDDSGIDGELALEEEEEQDNDDDDSILLDIENRSTALSEALNKASNDWDQTSAKVIELLRNKNVISSRYAELKQKYDQFSAEYELELSSSSTDDRF